MPAKPQWIVRLPAAIEALKALTSVVVDSKTLAGILRINLRSAQRVLQPFTSAEYGGMAERIALITGLERIAAGGSEEVLAEIERKAKVRAVLHEARNTLVAQSIVIAPPAARKSILATTVADLPATISVSRGELRIAFTSEQELWQQIAALTYARLNDEDGFSALIQRAGSKNDAV